MCVWSPSLSAIGRRGALDQATYGLSLGPFETDTGTCSSAGRLKFRVWGSGFRGSGKSVEVFRVWGLEFGGGGGGCLAARITGSRACLKA